MARVHFWTRGAPTPEYTAPTFRAGGFQFLEGVTLQRFIVGFHLTLRYFPNNGPGYNAPVSIVAGLRLTASTDTAPVAGPVDHPELDWLFVRHLRAVNYSVAATNGTNSFVDCTWSPSPDEVDVETQRRVGAGGNRLWLLVQTADALPFPTAGQSLSYVYMSTLGLGA